MGKAKELQTTTNIVKSVLKADRDARNSDDYLYIRVCEKINPICLSMPFSMVIHNRKDLGLPGFETVRRSRQKLQETCPELAGDSAVNKFRQKNEEVFRDYARGNV